MRKLKENNLLLKRLNGTNERIKKMIKRWFFKRMLIGEMEMRIKNGKTTSYVYG